MTYTLPEPLSRDDTEHGKDYFTAAQMQAAYEAGLWVAPEGYKLVPIVPTPEMIEAAYNAMYSHAFASDEAEAKQLLAAGIAAAPERKVE